MSPWATRKVTANADDQQNLITQHDVFSHIINYLQWQSITSISLMLSELKILGWITLSKIWLLLLLLLLPKSKSFTHKHTHYLWKHKRFKLNDEHNEMVENQEDSNHFAIREMRKTFTLLLWVLTKKDILQSIVMSQLILQAGFIQCLFTTCAQLCHLTVKFCISLL